ncbi:hypothetical protein P9112_011617 [Eukaryota sp. TZLM1-RC]
MSWTERLENAKNLANQIASDLNERDQFIRSEGAPPSRIQLTIRRNLHHLSQDLQYLEARLRTFEADPEQFQLSQAEINKRQDKVGTLKRRMNDLQSKLDVTPEAPKRGPVTETEDTTGRSNQDLLQSQQDKLRTFDKDIDTLAKAVRSTHEVGIAIKDELDEQEVLIDDITHRVGTTADNVNRTDSRLQRLAKNSKSKCLYCLILLLLIGVFVLLFW